jgi:hypothetical protein
MIIRLITLLLFFSFALNAQSYRWQQRGYYKMDIDFDAENHQYQGHQSLTYVNNSPDTLTSVFYHLYFNAFQPGSMMDVRSRSIIDPDRRVGDRISKLAPDEIGYIKVKSLKHNGKAVKFLEQGTILEVVLDHPILPGEISNLEMIWDAQVPLQIRRSGRNNQEGIDYSMAQWYPKLAEYDYMGWHSNPYIGREFHGLWGNFDVTISIDKKYVVGGSGVLQNADEIGYGYTDEKGMSQKVRGDKIDWHFIAENVHDFMWAADPDYTHTTHMTQEGTLLHFFYQENERTKENWENLPRVMDKALTYMNKKFGKYPYPVYSFIQGGDGGMEYPMATLITGERNFGSLVGVSVHEWFHSWYQMVLGSNESLYAWMDEGFTSFGSSETMNFLRKEKLIPGNISENPHKSTVAGFVNWKTRGLEEALSTHSDHFNTNNAYGQAAYTKGAIFMSQLEAIVGEKAFDSALLRYFNTWKFRHPNENDVIREFEKESGLELDWYKEYWVYSTHDIDYGIDSVYSNNNKTIIALQKLGRMPMPQDVTVVLNDGTEIVYNIPLVIMRGDKSQNTDMKIMVAPDWPWVNRNYNLNLDIPFSDIKAVYLDKAFRIADVNRSNNSWTLK